MLVFIGGYMKIGFNSYLSTKEKNIKSDDVNLKTSPITQQYETFLAKTNPTADTFSKRLPDAYTLGPKQNEVRIIDRNNVRRNRNYFDTARNSCSSDMLPNFDKNSLKINGEFNDFLQGRQGDCYLLSSIYSINQSPKGAEALKKNIQYNEDGSITVTLPGAIKAKEGYQKEGNGEKCAITGKYTITPEALKIAKSQAGKAYAYGDIEVIITELAMEAYRAEVIKTNENLGEKINSLIDVFTPGVYTGTNKNNPLDGGNAIDAIYILTGQKSEVYWAPKTKNIRPYIKGEFGYVGEEEKSDKFLKASKFIKKKELSIVNVPYNKDSELNMMLDKYAGKESDYAITVGVRVGYKCPDGHTKMLGGHAISVTKITDKYVEVVNPHNTTQKERIPRDIFEQMATKLNVAKM